MVITYDFFWHEVTSQPNTGLPIPTASSALVILMEYCNLASLARNVHASNRFGHRRGARKWGAIVHTLVDVLRGLVHLHDAGIIHGDIKASNVMLKSESGRLPYKFTAKIADLGLAKLKTDPRQVRALRRAHKHMR